VRQNPFATIKKHDRNGQQRRLSPVEPDSEECQALERAQKAIEILKRNLGEI
jgi:hypothetical protein